MPVVDIGAIAEEMFGDDPYRDVWHARPELTHVRDFARARRTAPWAVLAVVLARVVGACDPGLVLPPLIGGRASLNLYVALVGASGAGKDSALAVAEDAVPLVGVTLPLVHPGSGEGIAHAYMRRDKGDLVQHTHRVLLVAPEVDSLGALANRRGSTLLPELRRAWTGASLGFQYADPTRRLAVPAHAYRLCLVVGVQPRRAAALLDDQDAGTPQRFVWAHVTDAQAPDVAPLAPEPRPWRPTPSLCAAGEFVVCDQARAELDAAHLARVRGGHDELDAHAGLARLKIAAAFALWQRRTDITPDDWHLAGRVLDHSTDVRGGVVAELAEQHKGVNRARAEAAAEREVIVSDRVADHAVQRVVRNIERLLREHGSLTGAELRRLVVSRDRGLLSEAIERALAAGLRWCPRPPAPRAAGPTRRRRSTPRPRPPSRPGPAGSQRPRHPTAAAPPALAPPVTPCDQLCPPPRKREQNARGKRP
jgi:hypothetical protein